MYTPAYAVNNEVTALMWPEYINYFASLYVINLLTDKSVDDDVTQTLKEREEKKHTVFHYPLRRAYPKKNREISS